MVRYSWNPDRSFSDTSIIFNIKKVSDIITMAYRNRWKKVCFVVIRTTYREIGENQSVKPGAGVST